MVLANRSHLFCISSSSSCIPSNPVLSRIISMAFSSFLVVLGFLFIATTTTTTMATMTTAAAAGQSGGREISKKASSGDDVGNSVDDVDHSVPQYHWSLAQRTLFVAYIIIICLWIPRRLLAKPNGSQASNEVDSSFPSHKSNKSDANLVRLEKDQKNSVIATQQRRSSDIGEDTPGTEARFDDVAPNKSSVLVGANSTSVTINLGVAEDLKDRLLNGSPGDAGFQASGNKVHKSPSSGHQFKSPEATSGTSSAPPVVSFDQFLNKCVLFGAIMIFFYMCDYYKVFPQGERTYSRDTFLFLVFLLFLVAGFFTLKTNKDKILNREQTEEWKGWMQVMFVWYHYFKAKEWYNWIRVYIACYVWMTGFGNFSFFWVRKDFSLWRMLKMLFRLNFLVIFVAMVTNNEYMLYYICAMHTYWFLTVYVFMRVLSSWNTDRVKMAIKFVAYAVCNTIVFDIPGVSQIVFRPVHFILGRHDNSDDVMHEWSFRGGLDHWACFLGMLCAYNYPTVESFSDYLDAMASSESERLKKMAIRAVVALCALGAGFAWYFGFMREDKYAYNATHPYTSTIGIVAFIVLRNVHPTLRTHHLGMFSWLGKVTLETYLSQLHVYLLANATTLLVYLPGYPLLNFALATIVYLFLSHWLFNITNDSSSFLISKDRNQLTLHIGSALALFGTSTFLAYYVIT